MGGRIGINSISLNPMDQHYFATGGDDALGEKIHQVMFITRKMTC
jgi:hypothetical protein